MVGKPSAVLPQKVFEGFPFVPEQETLVVRHAEVVCTIRIERLIQVNFCNPAPQRIPTVMDERDTVQALDPAKALDIDRQVTVVHGLRSRFESREISPDIP